MYTPRLISAFILDALGINLNEHGVCKKVSAVVILLPSPSVSSENVVPLDGAHFEVK